MVYLFVFIREVYMDKQITDLINNVDMPIAIVLGGLPGSGKSTIASYLENNGFFIISKDAIRYELAKQKYGDKSESELDEHLHEFKKCIQPIIAIIVDLYFTHNLNNALNAITTLKNKNVHQYVEPYIHTVYSEIVNHNYCGIVFDATHFNKQQRRLTIQKMNNRLPIYCIYLHTSVDQAYAGVKKRVATKVVYNGIETDGRNVPKQVIEEMKKFESLPKIEEGFQDVLIIKR